MDNLAKMSMKYLKLLVGLFKQSAPLRKRSIIPQPLKLRKLRKNIGLDKK